MKNKIVTPPVQKTAAAELPTARIAASETAQKAAAAKNRARQAKLRLKAAKKTWKQARKAAKSAARAAKAAEKNLNALEKTLKRPKKKSKPTPAHKKPLPHKPGAKSAKLPRVRNSSPRPSPPVVATGTEATTSGDAGGN